MLLMDNYQNSCCVLFICEGIISDKLHLQLTMENGGNEAVKRHTN